MRGLGYLDRHFFKMLASSSGGTNMNVAGRSATPFNFVVAGATSRESLVIQRVNISMIGDSPLLPDVFGGSTEALTNGLGIEVQTSSGGQLFDFLDGHPVKINHDFALLAGVDAVSAPATSANAKAQLPVRWSIGKSGRPLTLRRGQQLAIVVTDDLSSAVDELEAMAQGYYTG